MAVNVSPREMALWIVIISGFSWEGGIKSAGLKPAKLESLGYEVRGQTLRDSERGDLHEARSKQLFPRCQGHL